MFCIHCSPSFSSIAISGVPYGGIGGGLVITLSVSFPQDRQLFNRRTIGLGVHKRLIGLSVHNGLSATIPSSHHHHRRCGVTSINLTPLSSASPLFLPFLMRFASDNTLTGGLIPADDGKRTVVTGGLGPSRPNNSLLRSGERSVQMVAEVGIPHFTNPPTFHSIWMGHGRTVSYLTTVPADGHTMTKFHRQSTELGNPIRFQTVYIWEDKEPVGPTAWKILSPHTESLRGIVDIVV